MKNPKPVEALDRHRLQPLLAPRSVAVVGASTRYGSYGSRAVKELVAGGYPRKIFPVDPRYESVEGFQCFDSLASLEERPELVQFCVANERLETQFELAASLDVPAAIVYGSCYLPDDRRGNTLLGRLTALARETGMQVCGGNCMGYRNLHAGVLAGIYRTSAELAPGPAVLISHSGTAFSVLSNLGGRVGFTLSVSAGQELATTSADYLDYAIELPRVRCVAMFLETIRNPEGFVRAVHRAHGKDIAVVVLKVGRSRAAARFAMSHTGALVGDDAAYQAFFDRHGIVRAYSLDERVNTIQLLAYGKPMAQGALTAALDSGGKRELLVDTAEEVGLPFANIDADTKATLAANLDPDLDPVNPLDHWGTGGEDWLEQLLNCLSALADDDNSALCAICGSVSWYWHEINKVAQRTDKPLALLTDFLRAGDINKAIELNQTGIAVLAGERASLLAIKAVMKYRDFRQRLPFETASSIDSERAARWRKYLPGKTTLDETASIKLMTDYGIPGPALELVEDEAALRKAAKTIGYPVVLKTAMPGITHKSDNDGVRLGLQNEESLVNAYRDFSARLGVRAMVARQAPAGGVEMALGVVRDPLLGAMVMIGIGGTLIELLDDKVWVLAPSNHTEVAHAIDRLKCRPLLDGLRGNPAVDVDGFVDAAVQLSILAGELMEVIAEIDVNPVLVSSDGCLALDVLVIPAATP